MRALVLVAVLSQSAFAQDPLVLRQRLAKLLKLSLSDAPRPTELIKRAPITPLACQVLGTLQSRAAEFSLANVQCGKSARSVRVGDALEDGVVEEIGFGTVTVRRGERLEQLGRGLAIASALPMIPPPTALPARSALEEGRVPRTLVEETLKNPAILLGQVQMLPAFANGKWAGLRANYVKEGSVVSTLGLQKNDVLRSVNGKPIDSVQSALAVLQVLGTATDIEVELERGGQSVTRRLRIE